MSTLEEAIKRVIDYKYKKIIVLSPYTEDHQENSETRLKRSYVYDLEDVDKHWYSKLLSLCQEAFMTKQ